MILMMIQIIKKGKIKKEKKIIIAQKNGKIKTRINFQAQKS